MTATEELRRMLDERGVEWRYHINDDKTRTWFNVGELAWFAYETPQGYLVLDCSPMTPEQAIATTLGAGTCHDTGDPSDFCCSECGVRMFTDTNETYTMIASDGRTIIKRPNFCPNCGRRIVEVDE